MIIYRCAKNPIKEIKELIEGKIYCFYDFGGELRIEHLRTGPKYIFQSQKEDVVLILDEESLLDRIKHQHVWRCYDYSKARKSTEEKILNK